VETCWRKLLKKVATLLQSTLLLTTLTRNVVIVVDVPVARIALT
jgi:hypothetical protein